MAIQDVQRFTSAFYACPQADWVGSNPALANGICASLAGAWARRMLDTCTGYGGAPIETAEQRFTALRANLPTIRANQQLFQGRNALIRTSAANSAKVETIANIVGRQGAGNGDAEMTEAALTLKSLVTQCEFEIRQRILRVPDVTINGNLERLMNAYDLTIVRGIECGVGGSGGIASAVNLVENVFAKQSAWVINTGDHAIGVYRTGGITHTDLYLYDPNYGEPRSKASDRAPALLTLLRTCPQNVSPSYKFYQVTRRS